MNSLLQLFQAVLAIAAAAAAIFAGQFSHMQKKQFNDVCKFMLFVSALLVVGSDLLNLIPAVQYANIGLSGMLLGGGVANYIVTYGIVGLVLYTGAAYIFSYHMLTKEKLQQVYEWAEGIVKNWQQKQSGIADRQPEEEQDETDMLQKLDQLRRKGVITEQEFDAKKKQLLNL